MKQLEISAVLDTQLIHVDWAVNETASPQWHPKPDIHRPVSMEHTTSQTALHLWRLDDIEQDALEMNVKSWRQKAVDREEWASVIKTAEGLRGSWSQGVSKLASIKYRASLLRLITQRVVVTSYRRFGPTYRVPSSVELPLEDRSDRLTRNVGKKSPLLAA